MISIIGVLVGLILPAVQAAREAARRSQCQNGLKEIGLALQNYHAASNTFPIGYIAWTNADGIATAPGWGWATASLAQLEQAPLYHSINIILPIQDASNATSAATHVGILTCPSDIGTGWYTVTDGDGRSICSASTTSYAANYGSSLIGNQPSKGNGLFVCNRAFSLKDVRDGSSSTLAIGERGAILTRTPWAGAVAGGACVMSSGPNGSGAAAGVGAVQVLACASTAPDQSDSGPEAFFGPHPGIVQFVMADGSVRPIKATVNLTVFQALATRSRREVIDQNAY